MSILETSQEWILILTCMSTVELRESECEALLSHCQDLQRRLYMASQASSAPAPPAAPHHYLPPQHPHIMMPYVAAAPYQLAAYPSAPYATSPYHPSYPYNSAALYQPYPHVTAQTSQNHPAYAQNTSMNSNNNLPGAPNHHRHPATSMDAQNAMASSPIQNTSEHAFAASDLGAHTPWVVKGPLAQVGHTYTGASES
jgi:hypothetical protein